MVNLPRTGFFYLLYWNQKPETDYKPQNHNNELHNTDLYRNSQWGYHNKSIIFSTVTKRILISAA